jgi:uncharacterized membrane protein
MNEVNETTADTSSQPKRGIAYWVAPLWSDPAVRWLALAGLVFALLLFAYVWMVFPSLPASLPLHWNSQAQVDIIGDPQELLRLPVFGLVVWATNLVIGLWALPRERAVTLFLLAGAVAAQIVFAAGALSIVLRAQ